MSRVAPKADVADILFTGVKPPKAGNGCSTCNNEPLRAILEDTLRGMLGEGPLAGRVPIYLTVSELHRRISDPALAKAAGFEPYPRRFDALRTCLAMHHKELMDRVKRAQREAGY